MPKSRVAKSKMFRDFSKMKSRYIGNNSIKNIRRVRNELCESAGITQSRIEFLVWAYDLEFFTIDYAADDYSMNKKNLYDRVIRPLIETGHVYKHFDKLTPSQTADDHLFRDETKYNYRVRYAITQKARLLVQRFYRGLED
jgi:hypothetical protein